MVDVAKSTFRHKLCGHQISGPGNLPTGRDSLNSLQAVTIRGEHIPALSAGCDVVHTTTYVAQTIVPAAICEDWMQVGMGGKRFQDCRRWVATNSGSSPTSSSSASASPDSQASECQPTTRSLLSRPAAGRIKEIALKGLA